MRCARHMGNELVTFFGPNVQYVCNSRICFLGNSQLKKKNVFVKCHFHNFDLFCELGTVPNLACIQSQWEKPVLLLL